jgi:hypothetical protein
MTPCAAGKRSSIYRGVTRYVRAAPGSWLPRLAPLRRYLLFHFSTSAVEASSTPGRPFPSSRMRLGCMFIWTGTDRM